MQNQELKTKLAEYPTLILGIVYILIGLSSLYFGSCFHSVALQSSGIDSLVGGLTEGLLLFGLMASKDYESIDDGYYFGYGHWKSTIVMNLVVSLIIFYGGCQVLYNGIQNLVKYFHGDTVIPNPFTIMVSGVVLVILIILLIYFSFVSKKNSSESLRESMVDLRSDLMTNLIVIISVVGIRTFHMYWLDGMFGILIGLLIIKSSMELFRTAILYLLDATPNTQIQIYQKSLNQLNSIKQIKSLKTHWVGDRAVILDLTIQVDGKLTVAQTDQLKQQVTEQMKKYPEIVSLNIMTNAN